MTTGGKHLSGLRSQEHSWAEEVLEKVAQNRHMLLDGVLSEDDVALLQDAIARATRVAAEQNIVVDQHDAQPGFAIFYWAGSMMRRRWPRLCSVRSASPCISPAL